MWRGRHAGRSCLVLGLLPLWSEAGPAVAGWPAAHAICVPVYAFPVDWYACISIAGWLSSGTIDQQLASPPAWQQGRPEPWLGCSAAFCAWYWMLVSAVRVGHGIACVPVSRSAPIGIISCICRPPMHVASCIHCDDGRWPFMHADMHVWCCQPCRGGGGAALLARLGSQLAACCSIPAGRRCVLEPCSYEHARREAGTHVCSAGLSLVVTPGVVACSTPCCPLVRVGWALVRGAHVDATCACEAAGSAASADC